MNKKPLYCFILNGKIIERMEIYNYRKVEKKSKNGIIPCIIAINPKTNTRVAIKEAKLDKICQNNRIYSFEPYYDNPAKEFINYYKKRKIQDISHTEVAPKSNKIVSWKCSKCGHNWDAMINSRVSKKAGCPCCSGRVPKEGMNDLATLYPELASEWNYEANLKDPTKYVTGSHYVASWKCCNCGHIWEKEIRRRIKHPECPVCHINILSAESQLSVFGLWIK